MPFTPFHFGLGLLFKSLERRFSFIYFAAAQVFIDLEPLYFIVTRQYPFHRVLHTYMGCTVVIVVLLVFLPLYNFAVTRILGWAKISFKAALLSAAVGAYSHVLLDSLLHEDMRPFRPFLNTNVALNIISSGALYRACLFSAVAGAIVWAGAYLRAKKS